MFSVKEVASCMRGAGCREWRGFLVAVSADSERGACFWRGGNLQEGGFS